jgi:hypothetical protein
MRMRNKYSECHCVINRVQEDVERIFSNKDQINWNEDIEKLSEFSLNQIRYMMCKTKAMLLLEHQKKVDSVGSELLNMNLEDKKPQTDDNTLNIIEWLFDKNGKLRQENENSSNLRVEFTEPNLNILETGGKNALLIDEGEEIQMDTLLGKKIKLNKKAMLIDLFPKIQPVMPKPFFYDIAADGIEYPNIAEIISELEGKTSASDGGLFGRIKGALWG